MNLTYQILTAVSILSFLYYGVSVLFSNAMVEEFERFGLSRFRKFTGILEVLGAVGLLVGYFFLPPLVIMASGGLTLLMILGVGVRLRTGPPVSAALPALAMALINLFIFVYAIRLVS